MEKLNRAQKSSILGPQNLGSRGGPGPRPPPPGSASGTHAHNYSYTFNTVRCISPPKSSGDACNSQRFNTMQPVTASAMYCKILLYRSKIIFFSLWSLDIKQHYLDPSTFTLNIAIFLPTMSFGVEIRPKRVSNSVPRIRLGCAYWELEGNHRH